MFCPRCGQQLPDNASFCFQCGQAMSGVNNALGGGDAQGNVQNQPQGQPPTQRGPNSIPAQTPWGSIYQNGVLYQPVYPIPQPAQPPAAPQQPKKEQVPDPTFSKFIDKPDPPLPFRIPKIILGFVAIMAGVYLLLNCNDMGTFRLIAGHAKDNIPGMSLLLVACLLIVAALAAMGSKKSKGAAGFSAVCYFFAAGVCLTRPDDFRYFTIYGITCMVFALVSLISAAGGVNIHLDD